METKQLDKPSNEDVVNAIDKQFKDLGFKVTGKPTKAEIETEKKKKEAILKAKKIVKK